MNIEMRQTKVNEFLLTCYRSLDNLSLDDFLQRYNDTVFHLDAQAEESFNVPANIFVKLQNGALLAVEYTAQNQQYSENNFSSNDRTQDPYIMNFVNIKPSDLQTYTPHVVKARTFSIREKKIPFCELIDYYCKHKSDGTPRIKPISRKDLIEKSRIDRRRFSEYYNGQRKPNGHSVALIILALWLSPEKAIEFYSKCQGLNDIESYDITCTLLIYYLENQIFKPEEFIEDAIDAFKAIRNDIPPEVLYKP